MAQLTGSNPREEFLLKLADSRTTLEQVLQWEHLLDSYKQGETKVHNFINNHIERLVQIMTIEGPPQDQIRSFMLPHIACEILSSGHTSLNVLLFAPLNSSLNSQPVCLILDYFQGTPNTILSGYVVKVLFAAYEHQPVKTQDFIFRRKYATEMVKFASSQSVADLIVSLIAIDDDRILTYYLNQRKQFLNYIADVYVEGKIGEQELIHLGAALYQLITKLWTPKCKQAGEFAQSVFKISQQILDNTNNIIQYNADLLPLVIQKFIELGSETPFILKQCASRIIAYLSNFQPEVWTSPSGTEIRKFSKQNLKLLVALASIITSNYPTVATLLNHSGCFTLLLDLVQKYELNNMVHIEVEKIFKYVIKFDSPLAYTGLIEAGNFLSKINDMVFSIEQPNKTSKKAYMGSMINILKVLRDSINISKLFGQLKKTNPEFVDILQQYVGDKTSKTSVNLAGCRLKLDYSIPQYDQTILQQKFKSFFEAEKIEKDPRQMENKYLINQIFNECQINKQWGYQNEENRIY